MHKIIPKLSNYGIAFLIMGNNLIDKNLHQELLRLSKRKKIYIFQIIDKSEYELPPLNNISLHDNKNQNIAITISKKDAKEYQTNFNDRQNIFETECRNLDISLIKINTEDNIFDKI